MGLFAKIKEKILSYQEEKKKEDDWRKQLEAEVREESKEEIKAGIKKAIIDKEKDKFLKSKKTFGEKMKDSFAGDKLSRMMVNVDNMQKNDTTKTDMFNQDKISSMMGKANVTQTLSGKSEKDVLFDQNRIKRSLSKSEKDGLFEQERIKKMMK
jgi:hypothetical protein